MVAGYSDSCELRQLSGHEGEDDQSRQRHCDQVRDDAHGPAVDVVSHLLPVRGYVGQGKHGEGQGGGKNNLGGNQ